MVFFISLFCASLLSGASFALEPPRYTVNQQEEFWVWNLKVMPPGDRLVQARATAVGDRSYIFVENDLWKSAIYPQQVERLFHRLESAGKPSGFFPRLGVLSALEALFAPLPKIVRSDERLVVLLTNLYSYKDHTFDGYYNAFDQLTKDIAYEKYKQQSNEVNMIYIDYRTMGAIDDLEGEEITASIIAHESTHLIDDVAGSSPPREHWFSELLGEMSMVATGYFTDQTQINKFALSPEKFSLLSKSYVHYGPLALFAAYLMDRLPKNKITPHIQKLFHSTLDSRKTVEQMVLESTGKAVAFDDIYGDFISYLYTTSKQMNTIPWGQGFYVPTLKPVARVDHYPFHLESSISPYSFAIIDLDIPPTARVELKITKPAEGDCPYHLRWKKLSKAIAVYAVGCTPASKKSSMEYTLSIYE